MNSFALFFAILSVSQHTKAIFPLRDNPFTHASAADLGDPLILTPYLEAGNIEQAKKASEVHLDVFQGVKSYSGYFTANKEANTNIFFWFFPSESNYATDPVVLWLQGGPGASSLYGLFVENGPFEVDDSLNVVLRNYSWHKEQSVIFIDQPRGTGFSYSDGTVVTNQTDVADDLYNTLIQFFTMFPEIQDNSFFISGESYAGKYVPAISYAIHQRNPAASIRINMKGIFIGNGVTDPINQFNYGDYLYQLGLIDLPTRSTYHEKQNEIFAFIRKGDYYNAAVKSLLLTEFYTNKTGMTNLYNYLEETDPSPTAWLQFIVQDDVRKAIHVGNQTFHYENQEVYKSLVYSDFARSVAPWLIELLNHYPVLLYAGQLDVLAGYTLIANYIQNLKFSAAEEYKTAPRHVWYVDNEVAGYVKGAGNLTELCVRDAGHMVPMDQPKVAYRLMYNFTRGYSLYPSKEDVSNNSFINARLADSLIMWCLFMPLFVFVNNSLHITASF